MESMVEKVARAICDAELPTDSKWEYCVPTARAAIEAMRTPTAAMVETGRNIEPLHSGPDDLFTAMIDAALKGEPS